MAIKQRVGPSKRSMTPEALAHKAVAKAVHEAMPDDRVRLELTVSLKTADAERLTALAITRVQNLDALVSEILEQYLHKEKRGAPRTSRRGGRR